jgi:hypothetical protein
VAMAEHPDCRGDREPFCQGGEHFRNALRRRFQTIERGIPPRTEGGMASKAFT